MCGMTRPGRMTNVVTCGVLELSCKTYFNLLTVFLSRQFWKKSWNEMKLVECVSYD
jgi:hypothetical protein